MEAPSYHYKCSDNKRESHTRRGHERKSHERIDVSILKVCRQIYAETRQIPPSTNIFSISRAITLQRLSESPHMRAQIPHITRLALVFYPCFTTGTVSEAWNHDLEAIYKRRSTPLFPSLKMLQLHIYHASRYNWYPQFNDDVAWSDLMSVWGFLYMAKENMTMVSVDSASFRYERVSSDFQRAIPYNLVTPCKEEQDKYEAAIKGHLLAQWKPDAQKHIEQLAQIWRKKNRAYMEIKYPGRHDWDR